MVIALGRLGKPERTACSKHGTPKRVMWRRWIRLPNEVFPIPNSHPQEEENRDFSYAFLGFQQDGSDPPQGRWSKGESIDGNGSFSSRPMEPQGEEPNLGRAKPNSGAQAEQE